MSDEMINSPEQQFKSSIVMDVSDAIESMKSFDSAVNKAAEKMAVLATVASEFETDIVTKIKSEMSRLSQDTAKLSGDAVIKGIQGELGKYLSKLKFNFTDGEGNAVQSRELQIKFGKQHQQRLSSAVKQIAEDALKTVKIEPFDMGTVKINQNHLGEIRRSFSEKLESIVSRPDSIKFDFGSVSDFDMTITAKHLEKMVEAFKNRFMTMLASPDFLKIDGEIKPIQLDSAKINSAIKKIRDSLGNIDDTLNIDQATLDAIPNIDGKLELFRKNMTEIVKEMNGLNSQLDAISLKGTAKDVKQVTEALTKLRGTVIDKVGGIVTKVSEDIATIPAGTLQVAEYKAAMEDIGRFVDSYVIGQIDGVTKTLYTQLGMEKLNIEGKDIIVPSIIQLREMLVRASEEALKGLGVGSVEMPTGTMDEIFKQWVSKITAEVTSATHNFMKATSANLVTFHKSVLEQFSKSVTAVLQYDFIPENVTKQGLEIRIPESELREKILPKLQQLIPELVGQFVPSMVAEQGSSVIPVGAEALKKTHASLQTLLGEHVREMLSKMGEIEVEGIDGAKLTEALSKETNKIVNALVLQSKKVIDIFIKGMASETFKTLSNEDREVVRKVMSEAMTILINDFASALSGTLKAFLISEETKARLSDQVQSAVNASIMGMEFDFGNVTINLDDALNLALAKMESAVLTAINGWTPNAGNFSVSTAHPISIDANQLVESMFGQMLAGAGQEVAAAVTSTNAKTNRKAKRTKAEKTTPPPTTPVTEPTSVRSEPEQPSVVSTPQSASASQRIVPKGFTYKKWSKLVRVNPQGEVEVGNDYLNMEPDEKRSKVARAVSDHMVRQFPKTEHWNRLVDSGQLGTTVDGQFKGWRRQKNPIEALRDAVKEYVQHPPLLKKNHSDLFASIEAILTKGTRYGKALKNSADDAIRKAEALRELEPKKGKRSSQGQKKSKKQQEREAKERAMTAEAHSVPDSMWSMDQEKFASFVKSDKLRPHVKGLSYSGNLRKQSYRKNKSGDLVLSKSFFEASPEERMKMLEPLLSSTIARGLPKSEHYQKIVEQGVVGSFSRGGTFSGKRGENSYVEAIKNIVKDYLYNPQDLMKQFPRQYDFMEWALEDLVKFGSAFRHDSFKKGKGSEVGKLFAEETAPKQRGKAAARTLKDGETPADSKAAEVVEKSKKVVKVTKEVTEAAKEAIDDLSSEFDNLPQDWEEPGSELETTAEVKEKVTEAKKKAKEAQEKIKKDIVQDAKESIDDFAAEFDNLPSDWYDEGDVPPPRNQFGEYMERTWFDGIETTKEKAKEAAKTVVNNELKKVAQEAQQIREQNGKAVQEALKKQANVATEQVKKEAPVQQTATPKLTIDASTVSKVVAERFSKLIAQIQSQTLASLQKELKSTPVSIPSESAGVLQKAANKFIQQYIQKIANALGSLYEGEEELPRLPKGVSSPLQKAVDNYIRSYVDGVAKVIAVDLENSEEVPQIPKGVDVSLKQAVNKFVRDYARGISTSVAASAEEAEGAQVTQRVASTIQKAIDGFTKAYAVGVSTAVRSARDTEGESVQVPSGVIDNLRKSVDAFTKSYAKGVSTSIRSTNRGEGEEINAPAGVTNTIQKAVDGFTKHYARGVSTSIRSSQTPQGEGIEAPENVTASLKKSVNGFVKNYAQVISASILAIQPEGMFSMATSRLDSDVRANLARRMNMTVRDFRQQVPVLEGDKALETVMTENIRVIMKRFHDLTQQSSLKAMSEYKDALNKVEIQPDTTAVQILTGKFDSLQKELNKKIKEVLDIQFRTLTESIRSLQVHALQFSYVPPTKASRTLVSGAPAISAAPPSGGGGSIRRQSFSNTSVGSSGLKPFTAPVMGADAGGHTRTFQGSVINTMRYILAGSLMAAPMSALYKSMESAQKFDYQMAKALQNFTMKDSTMEGVAETRARKRYENAMELGDYGISKEMWENEKLRGELIREEAQRLREMTRGGAVQPLQQLALTYGLNQQDVGAAWQIASRRMDDPYEALEMTKNVSRLYAFGREESNPEDLARGLESVMSQWQLGGHEMEKVANMLVKADSLSSANISELLETQSRAGAVFAQNMPGKTKEEAFATSLALSSAFIQSTARSGAQAGTFWRTVFQAPFGRRESAWLESMSRQQGFEMLNPYQTITLPNGLTSKEQKSGFDMFLDIMTAQQSMDDKTRQELVDVVFKRFHKGSAQAIQSLIEDMDKNKGMSMEDLIARIQNTTTDEVNNAIFQMQDTWEYRKQRVGTMWQVSSFGVWEELKDEFAQVSNFLMVFLRLLRDNADKVTDALLLGGKIAVALYGKHLYEGFQKKQEVKRQQRLNQYYEQSKFFLGQEEKMYNLKGAAVQEKQQKWSGELGKIGERKVSVQERYENAYKRRAELEDKLTDAKGELGQLDVLELERRAQAQEEERYRAMEASNLRSIQAEIDTFLGIGRREEAERRAQEQKEIAKIKRKRRPIEKQLDSAQQEIDSMALAEVEAKAKVDSGQMDKKELSSLKRRNTKRRKVLEAEIATHQSHLEELPLEIPKKSLDDFWAAKALRDIDTQRASLEDSLRAGSIDQSRFDSQSSVLSKKREIAEGALQAEAAREGGGLERLEEASKEAAVALTQLSKQTTDVNVTDIDRKRQSKGKHVSNVEQAYKQANSEVQRAEAELKSLEGMERQVTNILKELDTEMGTIEQQFESLRGRSELLDIAFTEMGLGAKNFGSTMKILQGTIKGGTFNIDAFEQELRIIATASGVSESKMHNLRKEIDLIAQKFRDGKISAKEFAFELSKLERAYKLHSTGQVPAGHLSKATGAGLMEMTVMSSLLKDDMRVPPENLRKPGGGGESNKVDTLSKIAGAMGIQKAGKWLTGTVGKGMAKMGKAGTAVKAVGGGLAKVGGAAGKALGMFKKIPYLGAALTIMDLAIDPIMAAGMRDYEREEQRAMSARNLSNKVENIREATGLGKLLYGGSLAYDTFLGSARRLLGGTSATWGEHISAWRALFSGKDKETLDKQLGWQDQMTSAYKRRFEVEQNELRNNNTLDLDGDGLRDDTSKVSWNQIMTFEEGQQMISYINEELGRQLGVLQAQLTIDRTRLLIGGYREDSKEIRKLMDDFLKNTVDSLEYAVDDLRAQRERLESAFPDSFQNNDAWKVVNQEYLDKQGQLLDTRLKIQENTFSEMDAALARMSMGRSFAQADFGMKRADAILGGAGTDSEMIKNIERQQLRTENTHIATAITELQKLMTQYNEGDSRREKILLQIRQLQAESKDNLVKIKEAVSSRSTFNLPSDIQPMTYWEATTRRNTHQNVSIRQGNTTINLTIDKMDGSAADAQKVADAVGKAVRDTQAELARMLNNQVASGMANGYRPI